MALIHNFPILASLLLSFAINMFFFLFAAVFKTDKVTDISYSLSFFILTLLLFFSGGQFLNPVRLIPAISIVLWSVRLGAYLLYRIIIIGKDERFDDKREDVMAFLKFWLLQAAAVWLIMLPHSLFLSSEQPDSSWIPGIIGMAVFATGLLIESLSDIQKFKYKLPPENKNHWVDTGLWKYSRHPNYFGELAVWWGLFIVVAPNLHGLQWLSIIGPISITVLLLFVSGIPLLEKSAEAKYGDNPEYRQYQQTTNILFPGPRKQHRKSQ